jgi:hypothetical protein
MLTTREPGINSDKEDFRAGVLDQMAVLVLWDELVPILQRSVEVSQGMMSLGWLEEWAKRGEASVFVTWREGRIESVLVATIAIYPYYRSARIVACAGKNLAEAADKYMDLLHSWALLNDCQEIEGWVLPPLARMAKKFGFRLKRQIVSLDLRSKLQ